MIPASTMVLFKGGFGGNFLCSLLGQQFGLISKTKNNNEYSNQCHPWFVDKHLLSFFKDELDNVKYTKRQYKKLLSAYQYTRIITIIPDNKQEFDFCESLRYIKHGQLQEVINGVEPHELPEGTWQRTKRHYLHFNKLHQGINKSYTYGELFFNPTKQTIDDLFHFCYGPINIEYNDIQEQIQEYTHNNLRILEENLNESAYRKISSVALV